MRLFGEALHARCGGVGPAVGALRKSAWDVFCFFKISILEYCNFLKSVCLTQNPAVKLFISLFSWCVASPSHCHQR